MKKNCINIIISFLFIFSFIACSRNRTVAVFNGGKVKLNELKEKIDNIRKDQLTIDRQKTIIRDIALRKLMIARGKKQGITKTKEYQNIAKKTYKSLLQKILYEQEIRNKVELNDKDFENYSYEYKFDIILITYNTINKKVKRSVATARKLSEKIYKDIISKKISFEEAQKKYNEASQDFEYKTFNRIVKSIRKDVAKSKSGILFPPTNTPEGIIIYRFAGKEKLSDIEFKEIKTQEAIYNEVFKRKASKMKKQFIDNLIKKNKIKIDYTLLTNSTAKDDAKIIESPKFTITLKKYREQLSTLPPYQRNFVKDFQNKKDFLFYNILQPYLLNKEIKKHRLTKSKQYKNYIKEKQDNYIYNQVEKSIPVNITMTEKDLKAFYDNNKDLFIEFIKGKKHYKPYNKVKAEVRVRYRNRALYNQKEQWKNQILKEADFRILDKNLIKKAELKVETKYKNSWFKNILSFFGLNREYKKYIALGDKYLAKHEKEKAILLYKKAITPEYKPVSAYLKIASVYYSYNDKDNRRKAHAWIKRIKLLKNPDNDKIIEQLNTDNKFYKLGIIELIGDLEIKDALDHLTQIFIDKKNDFSIRRYAVTAIGKLKNRESLNILIDEIPKSDTKLKWFIVEAIGSIGGAKAEDYLIETLKKEKEVNTRCFLVEALKKMRSKKAVPILEDILEHDEWGVQVLAKEALLKITGKEYHFKGEI